MKHRALALLLFTVLGLNAHADFNDGVVALMMGDHEKALFDPPWRIASVVVQDVRVKRAAELDLPQGHPLPGDFLLPYDVDLVVTLVR
jgi:hypothetical protein